MHNGPHNSSTAGSSLEALVLAFLSFSLFMWLLSMLAERLTEVYKLIRRALTDIRSPDPADPDAPTTMDTVGVASIISEYQAVFTALGTNPTELIQALSLLAYPRRRRTGIFHALWLKIKRQGVDAGHPAQLHVTRVRVKRPAVAVPGVAGDVAAPPLPASPAGQLDDLTVKHLKSIRIAEEEAKRAFSYWTLECRIASLVLGILIAWPIGGHVFHILVPFFPSWRPTSTTDIFLVGVGASMGSTFWHAVLDQVTKYKA
jgi:hypothetical protein